MENKKLLITHEDLDGLSVVILAKFFNLEFDKILLMDYKIRETEEHNEILKQYDEIYYTDFSPDEKNWEIIKNKTVYIFDHHESSSWLKDFDNVFWDTSMCGTKIFFNYLKVNKRIPNIIYEFVELVNIFDLWKQDSNLWKEANNLNRILYEGRDYNKKDLEKYSNFIGRQLKKFSLANNFYFTDPEKADIKIVLYKENQALKNAKKELQFRIDSRGIKFGLFKASSKISFISSEFLNEYTDIQYVIAINTYHEAKGSISVRSKEGFNCLDLKGIGGHILAGGGSFSDEEISNLWEGQTNELGYNKEVIKLFFDSEFTGLHKDNTLISIGLISDTGKYFYAEFNDYDRSQVDKWIQTNVIENLLLNDKESYYSEEKNNSIKIKNTKEVIVNELSKWLEQFTSVEIWSDCLSYDWVLFNDLFGNAFSLPNNIYYIPFDISTYFKVKKINPDINREEFAYEKIKNQSLFEEESKHNSLWDALVIKGCYELLEEQK